MGDPFSRCAERFDAPLNIDVARNETSQPANAIEAHPLVDRTSDTCGRTRTSAHANVPRFVSRRVR